MTPHRDDRRSRRTGRAGSVLAALLVPVLVPVLLVTLVLSGGRDGAAAAGHAGLHYRPAPPPPAIPDSESGSFVAGLPFQDPPVLTSRNGRLTVDLTARAQPVVVSGKKVNARVWNGTFMPPVLRVKPGDNLRINLHNELGEPTNVHTHGFFVAMDGNSDNVFVNLSTGSSFEYNYDLPADMEPGTYWYHPHFHPLVEEQVFGGMSGLIQVEGLTQLLPPRLRGVTQHYLALKDLQVDRENTIPARNINSDAPTTRTVNGLVQPKMTMRAGETQLWRLSNVGADIWYHLELEGLQFAVVGEDANPVSRVWTTKRLLMPPAKRFDVLVQATKPGTYRLMTRKMSTGPAGDTYPTALMATLDVTGAAKRPTALPTTFGTYDDLANDPVARTRTFTFSENTKTNQFFINGKQFTDEMVSATPIRGSVEEWVFRNTSLEEHPVHIHVNDMQLMSVNGRRYKARGWQDTIPIPHAYRDSAGRLVAGEIVVRMKFKRFAGKYVFHCHILAHEDNGMMGVVNVTAGGT
ncbi:MAG: multicopper oxidase family protein [Candidatus Nanopelagicales bacterium]